MRTPWDQARFLLEKGLRLMGRETNQIFAWIENDFQPAAMEEMAKSTLRDEATARAAWRAAGVKRSRR
jgi:hypothetical protein